MREPCNIAGLYRTHELKASRVLGTLPPGQATHVILQQIYRGHRKGKSESNYEFVLVDETFEYGTLKCYVPEHKLTQNLDYLQACDKDVIWKDKTMRRSRAPHI
tara:strand:+ start:273 stop:584 length:312 start_codon:yes stop_codon:yes gene_type:complete